MKIVKIETLYCLIFLLICFLPIFAQIGSKTVQNVGATSDKKSLEQVQIVISEDFTQFIEELNKFGKLGYRVEKAFNYGGDSGAYSPRFAAVLRIDSETFYEYDWMTSPNRRFIESRLNAKAANGYYVVHTLAATGCYEKESENDKIEFPAPEIMKRLTKGDIFLLERPLGKSVQVKEYKVFTGKIGIGKSPTTELQTALDNAPAGFHPFKVLFNKAGTFDFSVSVLLEKDLKNENAEKIQYKFFKDVNGFEKEINSFAQNGFQLIAGRRIGLIKFALLAKVPGDATSYILLDADKYQKEFDKKITSGNVYKGMFLGDTSCGEPETVGAKLVFARTADQSLKPEYKFLKLTVKSNLSVNDTIIADLKKLLDEDFFIRDIFYADGPVLIMEK